MKLTRLAQSFLLSATLVAGTAALAQVSFSINIGPPPPIMEVVPMMQPGYVWAPGYWAWNHDGHVWVRGRSMVQRMGYRWEPDRWEQRGGAYYRHPGKWARDDNFTPPKAQKSNNAHRPSHARGPHDKEQRKDARHKDKRDRD